MASQPLSNKYEQRAYIKICTLLDEKQLQIHEKLIRVFYRDTLSYPTVKEWARRVRRAGMRLKIGLEPDDLFHPVPFEIITQVQELVGMDPHLTIEEISVFLDFSSGAVHSILHNTLDCRKMSARWVPKVLTKEHKEKRVSCSKKLLREYYHCDPRRLYES